MREESIQVLVVDDEPNMRKVLRVLLEHDGYEVHVAQDGLAALTVLSDHHIDIIVSDLKMPRLDGMGLLRRVVEEHEGLPVIILTAHGTVDTAVEALKLGAFDYVTKPFDRKEMRQIVAKAVRTRELAQVDASVDRDSATGRYSIIGRSQPMRQVFEILDRVADTPSTVLITGESGTGKELVARALHENSSRKDQPYIRVNCAAIPPGLIESELFGYEKGAFTGAETAKPGRFELAHTGTLFLDEIGEISLEMQVKLLRVLQEGEFERVGGITTTKVDVRLVTATNQDLRKRISEGLFREDLFYRLNVVKIQLPALRERPGDIELLVEHFLKKYNARLNKKVQAITPEALLVLQQHPWPGNIRELENVIERCVLFCDTDDVEPADLPPDLIGPGPSEPPIRRTGELPLPADDSDQGGLKGQIKAATANLERQLIHRALDQTNRNVTRAARLLKISRKSLQTKMKELGLREEGTGEGR
jgi:nitrogen regulation protein NR(I)